MVEIPSAALAIEQLIKKVDFLAIGTNDLIQYLFAVNRDNDLLEKYRQNTHPAVLSLIKKIVCVANKYDKEVSVCGEIASDPKIAGLMVGLGIRNLSVQPKSIPLIRREISKYNLKELERMAEKALNHNKLAEC
jgi:phosphoenolpyruvate-protein kinase (PTS system EI component)